MEQGGWVKQGGCGGVGGGGSVIIETNLLAFFRGKLDKQDYLGDFALHLAAKNDNGECVKYLLNAKNASCNPFALDDQSSFSHLFRALTSSYIFSLRSYK